MLAAEQVDGATRGRPLAAIDLGPPFDIPDFSKMTTAPSCRASPLPSSTRTPPDRLKLTPLAAWLREQVIVEFIVDGLLRKGYLYTLTGPTGAGKTAVAVPLSLDVSNGQSFCGREVKRGPVVYIAGENPEDVRARFAVACKQMGIRPEDANVHVLDQSFVLADRADELLHLIDQVGPVLVVVDTDQAVSLGGDTEENSNSERMQHAKRLRDLTRTRSQPCVLNLCHPRARAGRDDLIPRGGSSLLAEIDGNLCLWRDGDRIEMFNDPNKFRGAPFSFFFKKLLVESDAVKDSKGRRIPVPYYVHDDAEAKRQQAQEGDDAHRLMRAMFNEPKGSQAAWASACGWIDPKGKPRADRVNRLLKRLQLAGRAQQKSKRWTLTPEGRAEVAPG